MKERASATNAAVKRLPAPIRNPSRDCSIKKSSEMAHHASGGLATYCCPCGPHRRATVAGQGLVGGTCRPTLDATLTSSGAAPVRSILGDTPRTAAVARPAGRPRRLAFCVFCATMLEGRATANVQESLFD